MFSFGKKKDEGSFEERLKSLTTYMVNEIKKEDPHFSKDEVAEQVAIIFINFAANFLAAANYNGGSAGGKINIDKDEIKAVLESLIDPAVEGVNISQIQSEINKKLHAV